MRVCRQIVITGVQLVGPSCLRLQTVSVILTSSPSLQLATDLNLWGKEHKLLLALPKRKDMLSIGSVPYIY